MDLTINRENVHLIIARETESSTFAKLDIAVSMINIDDPNNPVEPYAHDKKSYSAGMSYNYSKGMFISSVIETKAKIHIPYEIWAARSLFNEGHIIWYDKNKTEEVRTYLLNQYGVKGEAILSRIKFQANNE